MSMTTGELFDSIMESLYPRPKRFDYAAWLNRTYGYPNLLDCKSPK